MNPNIGIAVVGAHTGAYLMRCRRLPTPGEYLVARNYERNLDGAKGSNQALAAARLGARVFLIARLGGDEEGKFAREYLNSNGVDTSYATASEHLPTGFGIAFMDEEGTPMGATILGSNVELSRDHIDMAIPAFQKSRILVVSLEINVDVALYACKVARKHGLKVILNPSPADDLKTMPLQNVDILTPNEPEAKLLAGASPDENIPAVELAKELHKLSGVREVVITLGSKGAFVLNNDKTLHVPCPKVKAVDTSGAGDCFNSALAFALGSGASLEKAAEFAVKTATLSVARPQVWPSYPTLKEVLDTYGPLL